MILFDLQCGNGCAAFEAWFRSGSDYEEQRAGGLVQCPACLSPDIVKAPMAPRVPRKAGDGMLARLAAVQAELLKDSRWVGDAFADTARAMHNGEIPAEQVHGQATIDEASSLIEEGVPLAPLPFPVIPPTQVN